VFGILAGAGPSSGFFGRISEPSIAFFGGREELGKRNSKRTDRLQDVPLGRFQYFFFKNASEQMRNNLSG
jgi:hypothetical protein